MNKFLITGASGFIGEAIFSSLKKRNKKVILFKGDIRNSNDWMKNLAGGEIIIHCAGVRTETNKDFEVNCGGVEKMFQEILRSGKIPAKIIYISSQAVNLGAKTPYKESMRLRPVTIYGKSKLKSEEILCLNCKKLDIPLVILRLSPVFGSGIRRNSRMSGPLEIFVRRAFKNEMITVFQKGKQIRDYIGIKDVISAITLMISKSEVGVFNVGGGRKISVLSLVKLIKKILKSDSLISFEEDKFSRVDPLEVFSDIGKLKKLGWEPKQSIKSAVSEYINGL